jgi:hypothetical protein
MATQQTKPSTQQQELGSAWIFRRALANDINYSNLFPPKEFVSKKEQEIIKDKWINLKYPKLQKWEDYLNITLDKKYIELQKIFKPQYNPLKDEDPVSKAWLTSYYSQQKALLQKYSESKFKEARFDRDGGFMEFIVDKTKKLGISQKDTWDPADIWIVDTTKEPNLETTLIKTIQINEKYPTEQKEKIRKIQALNTLLRGYFRKNILIGVSLKKAGKTALYVPVNVKESEEKTLREFDEIEGIVAEIDKIICKLTTKPATETEIDKYKEILEKVGVSPKSYPKKPISFQAKHTEIYISDNVHKTNYKLDLISVDVRKLTNLKYEPVDLAHKGAKLGQAGVKEVQTLFNKYKIPFKNDHNQYPRTYDDPKVEELIKKFNSAKNKAGVKFESGLISMSEFEENLKEVFQADVGAAVSKLMQLDLLSDILELESKKLNEMLVDLIYMAQKKGRKYGPFGKVY